MLSMEKCGPGLGTGTPVACCSHEASTLALMALSGGAHGRDQNDDLEGLHPFHCYRQFQAAACYGSNTAGQLTTTAAPIRSLAWSAGALIRKRCPSAVTSKWM